MEAQASHHPASAPDDLIYFEFVDAFRLTSRGKIIEVSSRKARSLLSYVVLSDSGIASREQVAGLLWSEAEENKARQSLRQTVRELRRALDGIDPCPITFGHSEISVDLSAIDADIWQVKDAVLAGVPHPMLLDKQHIFDKICIDLEGVDPAFQTWLRVKRQLLSETISRGLEQLLAPETPMDNLENAGRALLNIDPTNEIAARALIRSRSAANDIGGALNVYKELWECLDKEYDVEPSLETQQLISGLKLSLPGTEDWQSSLPATLEDDRGPAISIEPPGKSIAPHRGKNGQLVIAINPFNTEGARKDSQYLVSGFRGELTACLVRFREWRIVDAARTAGTFEQAEMLRELGAFVIEGSAYQLGDAVKVIIVLRDTSNDVVLWSERLQLDVEGWFEVQEAIIRRLATALNVHVSAERLFKINHSQRTSHDAFDLWLQAQTLIQSFQPASWHKAKEVLAHINDIDPGFSPAYSGLAQLHNIVHLVHYGIFREPARAANAIELAREAVRLDPLDSRAQLCLGWAYLMANQYDRAGTHYALSYDLNENDPWTLVSSALGLAFSGEHDRARELADRALDLSLTPNATNWGYQLRIRLLQGDIDAAVEATKHAARVPALRGWWSILLSLTGETEEAKKEFALLVEDARSGWFGKEAATPEVVARWFLHSFPIRSESVWVRLRDGLAHAGAPVDALSHTVSDVRLLATSAS